MIEKNWKITEDRVRWTGESSKTRLGKRVRWSWWRELIERLRLAWWCLIGRRPWQLVRPDIGGQWCLSYDSRGVMAMIDLPDGYGYEAQEVWFTEAEVNSMGEFVGW